MFCVSKWLAVPFTPDKWNSAAQVRSNSMASPTQFTTLSRGHPAVCNYNIKMK